MKITVDLKFFILAIISYTVFGMTLNYSIDNYIHFAGEDNAMAFAFMSLFLGMIATYCSFEKVKK